MNLDYAYEAGRRARENSRPLSSCPTYAMNELGQPWRDAWKRGWEDMDRKMPAMHKPKPKKKG